MEGQRQQRSIRVPGAQQSQYRSSARQIHLFWMGRSFLRWQRNDCDRPDCDVEMLCMFAEFATVAERSGGIEILHYGTCESLYAGRLVKLFPMANKYVTFFEISNKTAMKLQYDA